MQAEEVKLNLRTSTALYKTECSLHFVTKRSTLTEIGSGIFSLYILNLKLSSVSWSQENNSSE